MQFKLQAEQAPNYHKTVLVYNKDRTIESVLKMTTDMNSWFLILKTEKIYFEGSFDPKTGKVLVTDILEDQDW